MSPDTIQFLIILVTGLVVAIALGCAVLVAWFWYLDRKFEETLKQIKSERPHG